MELKSAQLLAAAGASGGAGAPRGVELSCTDTLGAAEGSAVGLAEAGTSLSGIFSA